MCELWRVIIRRMPLLPAGGLRHSRGEERPEVERNFAPDPPHGLIHSSGPGKRLPMLLLLLLLQPLLQLLLLFFKGPKRQ